MSVNPVSQAYSVASAEPAQKQAPQKTQTPETPQDSVQLSPQAKAALAKASAGDVDHDGDSH